MAAYEVAIFGDHVDPVVRKEFQQLLAAMTRVAESYGLQHEGSLRVVENPALFQPDQRSSAVAIFFGSNGAAAMDLGGRFDSTSVTVIPVAPKARRTVWSRPRSRRPFGT